jgi:hypothetical protein
MQPPTLTLRYARTTDAVLLTHAPQAADRPGRRWQDVVAVDHADGETARWPWYYTNKPSRRRKYVWLNCVRYLARWVG